MFASADNTHSLDLERDSSQNGTVAPQNTGSSGTIEFCLDPEFATTGTTEYFVMDGTAGTARFLFYKNGFASDWGLFIGGASMSDGNGSLDSLVDNTGFTCIAVAWDSAQSGSDRVIVYKNGAEFQKINADPAGNMPATLYVGSNNGQTNFYDGLIDDIRIWDDQRTAGEIASNYCPSTFSGGTGLIDHWKLDNAYTNEIGGSNTISANNTPSFSTSVLDCGEVRSRLHVMWW